MLRNTFLKTLWDQRRGLLGWSIGIAAIVLLEAALYPSVRDMPNLEDFLASFPEAMLELFDIGAMSTGVGFFNAELFTLLMPILFIIFGISRGARTIAGEEEDRTLDAVLVTPMSTTRLLLEKAAALATSLLVLGVVVLVTTLVGSVVFDMGITLADALPASVALALLGIEFAFLALAVGAATGRRLLAIGVAAVVAVAMYLLYAAGLFVDALEPWQPVSPFGQAFAGGGPLGVGWQAAYLWLAVGAVVVVAIALPIFDRRDIGIH